jgi:hypothetical protein
MPLRHISVTLTIGDSASPAADTNGRDNLFVGVVTKDGGREFPLGRRSPDDTDNFPEAVDDYPKGTHSFAIGFVPGDPETRVAFDSLPGGRNDPLSSLFMEIDGEGDVLFVYLRKQGLPDLAESDVSVFNDDAIAIEAVRVGLISLTTERNYFANLRRPLYMGHEFGHILYLKESR